MYLYTTTLFRNSKVIGINPAQNLTDINDYEDNRQSSVVEVSGITIEETAFVIPKTYADFKSLITGDIDWGDVQVKTTDAYYKLNLLSGSAL